MKLTVLSGRLELVDDDDRPIYVLPREQTHDGALAFPTVHPLELWVGRVFTSLSMAEARQVIAALQRAVKYMEDDAFWPALD